jgi:hypothetical protein
LADPITLASTWLPFFFADAAVGNGAKTTFSTKDCLVAAFLFFCLLQMLL